MTDSDIDGDDMDEAGEGESAASSTGGGGVDSVTPQAEVSGGDPAGFEPSGIGEAGEASGGGGDEESSGGAGGVGDWDPSSAGGGGGEVY